ncbi:hypothetical protein SELMODRAFT_451357 [Selaginella moellendorffii]|uniref:Uncharacterized protein WOX9-1 n=1 Tax=Selaginella moellendorffii TaxID=88036 RepID=D8R3X4_SELML|nr:hypothetical protein SELMODRAFT_451357 [Selaginella moellendorffii]
MEESHYQQQQQQQQQQALQELPPAVVKVRWKPNEEQLRMLVRLFEEEGDSINKQRIKEIAVDLARQGDVTEANVHNWFHNRKARAKRKQKQMQQNDGESEVDTDVDSKGKRSKLDHHHHHHHHHHEANATSKIAAATSPPNGTLFLPEFSQPEPQQGNKKSLVSFFVCLSVSCLSRVRFSSFSFLILLDCFQSVSCLAGCRFRGELPVLFSCFSKGFLSFLSCLPVLLVFSSHWLSGYMSGFPMRQPLRLPSDAINLNTRMYESSLMLTPHHPHLAPPPPPPPPHHHHHHHPAATATGLTDKFRMPAYVYFSSLFLVNSNKVGIFFSFFSAFSGIHRSLFQRHT